MNARYTDRDMRTRSYEILEQTLDYKFNDSEFIIEALTHRSHKHEFGDSDHNERLEFLGDAVLDLCVTEMIMWRFRWKDEGHLSKLRSQLVSESALAKAARSIELGSFLRLGKGEEMGGGRDRDSLLADALEAIFGAIYIDSTLAQDRNPMEECKRIVQRVIKQFDEDGIWNNDLLFYSHGDFKSYLQEFCQSYSVGAPKYTCVEEIGPDHNKEFVMSLSIEEEEMLKASGKTKKQAAQAAAREFLTQFEFEAEKIVSFFESQGWKLKKRKRKTRDYEPAISTN